MLCIKRKRIILVIIVSLLFLMFSMRVEAQDLSEDEADIIDSAVGISVLERYPNNYHGIEGFTAPKSFTFVVEETMNVRFRSTFPRTSGKIGESKLQIEVFQYIDGKKESVLNVVEKCVTGQRNTSESVNIVDADPGSYYFDVEPGTYYIVCTPFSDGEMSYGFFINRFCTWIQDDNGWRFYDRLGTPSTSTGTELYLNGSDGPYCLVNGYRYTGWYNPDPDIFKGESTYEFSSVSKKMKYYKDGKLVKGVFSINSSKYYFDESGYLKKRLIRDGSKRYYGDETTGEFLKGWKDITNQAGTVTTRLYFGKDYVAVTGWKQINSKWYYFDEDEGMLSMLSDTTLCLIGKEYVKSGGSGYAPKTGASAVYYFKKNGQMVTGWVQFNKKWRYFESSGKAVYGWKKIKNKWYYFDENNAEMRTGILVQDSKGKDYSLFSSLWDRGIFRTNMRIYCLNPDGTLFCGWKKGNQMLEICEGSAIGSRYMDYGNFFHPYDKDEWYYFDSNGLVRNNWKKIGGKWYFFNEYSTMATGWKKIANNFYYFNNKGVMQTGWKKISGEWFYFNSNGKQKLGWVESDGKWYYYNQYGDSHGYQYKDIPVKIGSKVYYFDKDGVCQDQ